MPPTAPASTTRAMSLPDVTEALAWRDWTTGLEEAGRRRVPILALAEAPWTNSAQRLGLVFEQDASLRALLEETFVPILVDPVQRPDLVSRWQWASIAIAGTSGPPLVLWLTHEGAPFLSYCSMWPEGRPPHPSLAALARATADAYARDPDAFVREGQTLDSRSTQEPSPAYQSARELWQRLGEETDATYGGIRESPKHPHPQLLLLLLERGEAHDAPDAVAFVQTTLRAMLRGGINDQVAAGFHRCSRDERWIVPHFEKPAPLNAQLASVYAKAAHVFGDDAFLAAANALATFCLGMARDGVDAVASDSHYYTWTAREMLGSLDPALVQAVSLHYNLIPDRSRQVLYRARDAEAISDFSSEAPAMLRQRIEAGRRQLRLARSQRRPPELVQLSTLSWPAQTMLWLFSAAEQGCDVPVAEMADRLERLTADRFREGIGYPRPGGRADAPQAWLEDQAALLGAMLAAGRATRDERWLGRARLLADVILDRYGHAGGLLDRPPGRGAPELSRAVTDDVLPSAIATAIDALADLGQALGDDRYVQSARRAATTHLPSAGGGAQWAAAMWRVWFRIAGESRARS